MALGAGTGLFKCGIAVAPVAKWEYYGWCTYVLLYGISFDVMSRVFHQSNVRLEIDSLGGSEFGEKKSKSMQKNQR